MKLQFKSVLAIFLSMLVVVTVDGQTRKTKRKTSSRPSASIPSPKLRNPFEYSADTYSDRMLLAAETGDVDAQVLLGICYEDGKGIAKDESKALYWYELAADGGDAYGMAYAGIMYVIGKGCEKNVSKGFRLIQKSANQGNRVGEVYLGDCYYHGVEGEPDVLKAWEWYKKASEQGSKEAKKRIEEILADEENGFIVTYNPAAWNTEPKAWGMAKKINTPSAYSKYLELYPYGLHSREAEDAYMESTVKKVSSGNYAKLPEGQKVRQSYDSYSNDRATNDTQYDIEVIYSGPDRKRIIIPKGETRSVRLKNGNYEIVAKTVKPSDVENYYGYRLLDGDYVHRFYIYTSYGRR